MGEITQGHKYPTRQDTSNALRVRGDGAVQTEGAARNQQGFLREVEFELHLKDEVGFGEEGLGESTLGKRSCLSKGWEVGKKCSGTWAWSNICKLGFAHIARGGGYGAVVEARRPERGALITLSAGLYIGILPKIPSTESFPKIAYNVWVLVDR